MRELGVERQYPEYPVERKVPPKRSEPPLRSRRAPGATAAPSAASEEGGGSTSSRGPKSRRRPAADDDPPGEGGGGGSLYPANTGRGGALGGWQKLSGVPPQSVQSFDLMKEGLAPGGEGDLHGPGQHVAFGERERS